MSKINLIATAAFGLEASVKREVAALGFADINVRDGRVDFTGGEDAIPRANLWLRCADRVLLKLGEFQALSFDELFEKTKALPWEEWISKNGKFTVTGKSVRSKLFSVPDCQAIVKKAIVERLKQKYKVEWFEESGEEYKVQVALLKDEATLTIDTSGSALHKRGYRRDSVAAPIKETLAYGLIELSYWRRDRILFDPLCGSGTIPIEAALAAKNIAPGLSRKFVSEDWGRIAKEHWASARKAAYQAINNDITPELYGSDIDPNAIAQAKHNADLAGVGDCMSFEVRPLEDATLPGEYGVLIANPPYAERLGSYSEVSGVYSGLGRMLKNRPDWSCYVITPDEQFEKLFGRRADSKRKLFNGMIKTDYYQYHGERPPKKAL